MATDRRDKKFKRVAAGRQKGLVVILEDIHDPHNAAAVFRSCDAFGIQKIYLVFDKEKKFNPRKLGKSTSSSANKWLDFEISSDINKVIQSLKKDGYNIYGTAIEKSAQDLYETDFTDEKVALVFGNEHRGLSKKALKLCDKLVKIPMQGMVQSLNLSVSAAILIYEVTRQRYVSQGGWTLSDRQAEYLYNDFKAR